MESLMSDEFLALLVSTDLSIPVIQILLLLVISTLTLLFGRVKLALMTNYLFALYWGYFLNRDLMMEMASDSQVYTFVYFGVGLLVAILAGVGFLAHKD